MTHHRRNIRLNNQRRCQAGSWISKILFGHEASEMRLHFIQRNDQKDDLNEESRDTKDDVRSDKRYSSRTSKCPGR